MAEYIDRRKICYTWWQKQDGTITDGVTLQSVIDDMPTADVVPVVRCKNCKHWNNGDCYRIELTRPDDYCSYAEKEANNEL